MRFRAWDFVFVAKIHDFGRVTKDYRSTPRPARKTKGFCRERRQVRTCYDLAIATEEIPTLSSRAEVEGCLSNLFSFWLAPPSFLGLFLGGLWLRLLHLWHRSPLWGF